MTEKLTLEQKVDKLLEQNEVLIEQYEEILEKLENLSKYGPDYEYE